MIFGEVKTLTENKYMHYILNSWIILMRYIEMNGFTINNFRECKHGVEFIVTTTGQELGS